MLKIFQLDHLDFAHYIGCLHVIWPATQTGNTKAVRDSFRRIFCLGSSWDAVRFPAVLLLVWKQYFSQSLTKHHLIKNRWKLNSKHHLSLTGNSFRESIPGTAIKLAFNTSRMESSIHAGFVVDAWFYLGENTSHDFNHCNVQLPLDMYK